MKANGLAPKQKRFVQEYLKDLNGKQAAIRAGYSAKSAEVQASRLLGNAKVSAAVAASAERSTARAEVTHERVIGELALIAFSDIGEVLDFTGDQPRLKTPKDIAASARRAISSVKVKRYVEGHGEAAQDVEVMEFKFWSKDSALEKLGKYLGLFIERREVTGLDGGPIQHQGTIVVTTESETEYVAKLKEITTE